MRHTRGQPYHPMTQGKIERYHRSLKNRILLAHYYLPGELEARLAEFVDLYYTRRYHESLGNLTPADIYFGRGSTILARRQTIKHQTIELRRHLHQRAVAWTPTRWLFLSSLPQHFVSNVLTTYNNMNYSEMT